jgi:transposase
MEGLKLTWWQRHRLQEQLKATQEAHLYRRTLAVLEVGRGRSMAQVAQALDVTRQSVYNWIASYAKSA